jgi:hypothetical protein
MLLSVIKSEEAIVTAWKGREKDTPFEQEFHFDRARSCLRPFDYLSKTADRTSQLAINLRYTHCPMGWYFAFWQLVR